MIRLMVETGVRAGEVAALELADVDLMAGHRRRAPWQGRQGPRRPVRTADRAAIDRYLRAAPEPPPRRPPALWLGDRGKAFNYDGLHKSLGCRAQLAGIKGFHPHQLRHTAAHRWLAAGGSEGGLMAVAGWTRPTC